MKKLEQLESLKKRAESDFEKAVELKHPLLIASAMDRLNKIDKEILAEEQRRREEVFSQENAADQKAPGHCLVEAKRQELISQFEYITGKSLKEILDHKKQ